jgi:fatty acid desaturase
MNARFTFGRTPQNPIVQILAFVVAGIVLVGAVFMGFVILAVLLGVGFILGIVFWLRLWWARYKMQRSGRRTDGSRPGRVIEVEYTVIDEDEDEDEDRRS